MKKHRCKRESYFMIGVLFHGPEVFDTGWAKKVINSLQGYETKCLLGGTMGRTAIIDSGMKEVEITNKKPPDRLVHLANECKAIILVSYSKSMESGHADAGLLLKKSGIKIPTIKLECRSKTMSRWNSGDERLIEKFEKLGFKEVKPPNLEIFVWKKGDKTYRRIHAVSPEEFILANGIIVGKAISKDVIVVCRNDRIIDIEGVEIKEHGLEKLGKVDIKELKLDSTTSLRRTNYEPRIIEKGEKREGIAFVDHAAMDIYELVKDAEGIVTVGDDTTSIAGDIAYRFQIPIIGIIDGDKDGILEKTHTTEDSIVLKVKDDDDFGKKVFYKVFKGETKIKKGFDAVKAEILDILRGTPK